MDNKRRTQKTDKDYEIPIPKRSNFLRDLKKAATPQKPKSRNRPKK
jgi:hypothetical protein